MSDAAAAPPPPSPDSIAVRHFLSAVHEAIQIPAPTWPTHRRSYLKLLERRAVVARASIGRLLADPGSSALDYTSEGDHIRQTIADMVPDTCRHRTR
ncbi:MAG: hypothetical protein ACRDOK_25630 [Streptosporangiaceae bacterium]